MISITFPKPAGEQVALHSSDLGGTVVISAKDFETIKKEYTDPQINPSFNSNANYDTFRGTIYYEQTNSEGVYKEQLVERIFVEEPDSLLAKLAKERRQIILKLNVNHTEARPDGLSEGSSVVVNDSYRKLPIESKKLGLKNNLWSSIEKVTDKGVHLFVRFRPDGKVHKSYAWDEITRITRKLTEKEIKMLIGLVKTARIL